MKTKVMIKKKSNVRKYSRKVKNKKVKYSKKLMSGGANPTLSFTIPNPTTPSLKNPLMFKFNTPFEKKIMELYEFSKLEADKDYISQIFRKFKYSYAQTNPAYKETDSILYLKKDEVDKEKNPTEVFKVYAPTNQSISIEYNYDKKFKDIGKFYEITPLELSVDTMQLAVNTGKLEISTDKDGNSYLGFVDFPSLVITEKPSGTGFSYSSRKNATWISVYEEKFEDEDKLFDLIETMDGRHIEQTTFDNEIKSIDVKIIKLDKIKNKDEIINLENSKPKLKSGDYMISMTNEELFIKKQNEMRQLLSEPESDEKAKLKLKIEEQVKYRAHVNIENNDNITVNNSNNNSNNSNNTTNIKYNTSIFKSFNNKPKKYLISENIDWVLKNSLWLEKFLALKKEDFKDKKLLASELSSLIGKKYECDLSGLDEQYIIVNEFINKTENGGDGLEYVICGYPDKKMKENVLNFWQDKNMKENLDKVHKEQYDTNCQVFLDLFNKYKKKKFENVSSLFKFRKEFRKGNFKERYNKLYENDQDNQDYLNFKNNFEYNSTYYFEQIAKKYLPKPILYINYIFLVFKKNKDSNTLEPFIFNIKQLELTHQSILKHIERLIKHELSYKFNILKTNELEKFPLFDDEYKLWYSRYRYGDVFHISTNYVYTMSNITDKAHNYKNSMTLDELIYSCSINSNTDLPFFKNVKLKYEIREYKLNYKNKEKNIEPKLSKEYNDCTKYETGKKKESRSDLVFCLYEEEKLKIEKEKLRLEYEKNITVEVDKNNISILNTSLNTNIFKLWKHRLDYEKNKEIKINKIKNLNKFKEIFKTENKDKIQFILMFQTHQHEYTFIYKYDNKFYKLVIQSNISYILDDIINKFKTKVLSNNMIIKFNNINKSFKVINNDELDDKDYGIIFSYNPVMLKKYFKININNKIDTLNYYDSSMLHITTFTENLLINLYKSEYKSSIYWEHLNDSKDIKFRNTNCNQLRIFTNKHKEDLINKKLIINCVFNNVNNSGYDFWEFLNIKENKLLIFIVPSKENVDTPYLSNFMDLDGTNKNILKMLESLKIKYLVNNYECFFHYTLTLSNNTLHLHVIKKDHYQRKFPKIEIGSGVFLLKAIYIENLINFIIINPLYYKNININQIQ